MKPPPRQPNVLRLLKGGDVLVRTLLGARTEYRLMRADLLVEPETAAVLLNCPFLGGRLWPERDGLPGFEASQTWRWRKNPARPRKPIPQEAAPCS